MGPAPAVADTQVIANGPWELNVPMVSRVYDASRVGWDPGADDGSDPFDHDAAIRGAPIP